MSKTFCVLPWTHFFTQPDGTVKVCCLAAETIRKPDSQAWSVRHDTPAAIWNSDAFKSIRDAMLKGEEVRDCRGCYDKEWLGLGSRRTYANTMFAGLTSDPFVDRLVSREDPLTARTPIYFDLRLGNLCNLKCRMCSGDYSSQIERDPVAAKWAGGDGVKRIGETPADWPGAQDLLENLREFAVDAYRIELIGGEPTLNGAQLGLLKHFIDRGNSQDIELYVISNMTNLKSGAFELFSKFKDTHIDVSLDGVGSTFDYIRFPAKWEVVSRNIDMVRQRYPSLTLSIHPTYQAYNILDVCSLFDWAHREGLLCRTFNVLFYPRYLNIGVLPQNIRDIAAARMQSWALSNEISDEFRSGILDLVAYLRNAALSASQSEIEQFVQYTNDLDRSRGQDISVALPELYQLWTESRPWDRQATRHFMPESSPV
ncbi:MAG: twitch domain-containing radical SAM protein [Aestuariivirga sp.]|nr:twitch domain-containing radical SAM protein [Aestuariivirga sp.]